jgi:Tol biopolymer transport system component
MTSWSFVAPGMTVMRSLYAASFSTLRSRHTPTTSPDGRRLAFAWLPLHPPKTGSLSEQIAVINADGSGLRVLTRNTMFKGGAAHPVWSPDGQTLLFSGRMSLAEGARADVWSIRPSATDCGG